MIRPCSLEDAPRIYRIINDAAQAYKGAIPKDCYQEPYMPLKELLGEMGRMTFFGWEEKGELLGVMGYQPVKDVTLVRHAYVLTSHQGQGIGGRLLEHMKGLTRTRRLLLGTWAAATWATSFYEKRGFRFLPDKDELLRTYWDIPERQIEASVVMGLELEQALSPYAKMGL